MFDDFNICPYTGLRSFTEEESIYFKGRDEHIQEATKQLEENKFLMLTGASGDGKSSLVYAGIIPNARSGFLKATYSNWQIADFRPERSPLDNLSASLANSLEIDNIDSVKAEIRHGFSAIIDLYKSSKRFVDPSTNEWKNADESGKAAITRDASNLIILADQFEEFFTNPENYQKGAPSVESALVLNLLLETARIALEDDLPIYVVFTMRSDYIGQCAAFRGLPEYIGFSQFFVPRMNRKQLQEVIEDPAELSGNRISRRLTERLIEDITDGGDQLPMLQHALNQIWKMADSGKEEMDLIHYAMVGGLATDDLPDDEKVKFVAWYNNLPDKIKVCYDQASLQNVLNTHANILNNHASSYVKKHSGNSIADEDTKLIIKTSFQCLTKINEGRAVRNRMTLEEITNIINKPEYDFRSVNHVLNAYRDSSNTLLKPFIGEENENIDLEKSTVLDITHESLIRNWSQLKEWAKEEIEDYTIYLDFNQQLERWIENDRSLDFLLSIGPLTYFEDWFKRKQPNKFWVARYKADDGEVNDKLQQSEIMLDNAQDFLDASASKHFVTRTVMKYGPRRIAAVVAIVVAVILSSFTIKTYIERTDASMRKFLIEEMKRYSNDPSIRSLNIIAAYIEQIRLDDITAPEIVDSFNEVVDKVSYSTGIATWMYTGVATSENPTSLYFHNASDSLLTKSYNNTVDSRDYQFLLRESNDLGALLEISHWYSQGYGYKPILENNARRLALLVSEIVTTQNRDFGETGELNDAIEYALNQKAFTKEEISELLADMSPFETSYQNNNWLKSAYSKPAIHVQSNTDQGFNYNGLYQELAYLYASQGNISRTIQALDTLLEYRADYPDESYLESIDNAFNIAGYFVQYGHMDQHDQFVKEYCKKDNIEEQLYYRYFNAKSKLQFITAQKLSEESANPLNRHHNSNIDYNNAEEITFYHTKAREAINSSTLSSNEKKFFTALNFKQEGLKLTQFYNDLEVDVPGNVINEKFEQAIFLYQSLPASFLNEEVDISNNVTSTRSVAERKFLFLYPSERDTFNAMANFDFKYDSPAFIEYIIDSGLFAEFYSDSNIGWLDEWYTEALGAYSVIGFTNFIPVSIEFSQKLLQAIEELGGNNDNKFSLLFLNLANQASNERDAGLATDYYSRIDPSQLLEKLNIRFGFQRNDIMRRISYAIRDLYNYDRVDLAQSFIQEFNNPINRSSIYAYAAMEYIKMYGKEDNVNTLIDSSYVEMENAGRTIWQPNRWNLAAALAFRNESGDIDKANSILKNEEFKANGIWWITRGLAFNGELYSAYQAVPDFLSDDDVCGYLFEVYHNYNRNNHPESHYWNKWESVNDNADARIYYLR